MSYSEPARTTTRWIPRILVAGLLVVIAALIGVRVYQSRASSSSSAATPIAILHGDQHTGGDGRGGGEPVAPQPRRPQPAGASKQPEARVAQAEPGRPLLEGDQRRRGAPDEADGAVPPVPTPQRRAQPGREGAADRGRAGQPGPPPLDTLHSDQRGAPDEADGAVSDGTTVFDDEIPAVANLDPALLGALRQAATDAADDGVEFVVDSGWRSPEYQEQLLHEAVSTYGSEEEAARWVATPTTSAHVSGNAVDIGPFAATVWLAEHGAGYGLCQIYNNEPWHYELRSEAIDHGCPPMYVDPTHDPRMEQ